MRLDLTSILKKAIQMEIGAQKMYSALLKKATTQNEKSLFESLAVEEQKHEAILKEVLHSGTIEASKALIETYKTGFSIHDKIMDPSFDQFELSNGIILAVQEERKAAKFYMDAFHKAEQSEKKIAIKELLISLAKEEKHHESILIEGYRKLFGTWDENVIKNKKNN